MCTENLSNETTSVCKQRRIPGFPFYIHTHELNLQLETSPRGVPVSCTDRNT